MELCGLSPKLVATKAIGENDPLKLEYVR